MNRLLPLFLPLLLACDPTYLDEGLLVRGGLELHVTGPQGVSGPFANAAGQWWNEQCGVGLFYSPTPTPDVTIETGYVPSGSYGPDQIIADEAGIAYIDFSRVDGLILGCEVVLSSDIAYDDQTLLETAKHEIGHCLGLADDPHSLDLNSIMSSPIGYRGQVTAGDCALVLERFEWL